ncbi:MAG TPA: TlpA disulfide reductase family protein [Candidatus Eisenbacteria bacterium]|nr:TlpA disulfide reductase family protein [Candidatus Eisenbacteria bacterium]
MKAWSLAAALLLAAAIPLPVSAKSPAASTPAAAPHFSLPGRGGIVDSDSLRGKLVLVDFWASWCGPCQQSFPWMAEMYARYSGKGFTIVAVNLDKERGLAEEFLGKHNVAFPVAFDPSGKTAKAYQVWGMPTSFLVGPKGEILSTHMGFDPKNSAAFEAAIRQGCPQ